MNIAIIENNLVCFFTGIFYYYQNKNIDIITNDENKVSLLDTKIQIDTDIEKARRVRNGIAKKIGQNGYKDVLTAFCSCDKEKDQKIFEYLKKVFLYGKDIKNMFQDKTVITFNDLLKKVNHEIHRMHGFIRFKEMQNGIYYSYFSGDNDILEFILPFFIKRYNNQKFVLHDIKRKKMAYFDGKIYHTFIAPDKINIVLSKNELLFDNLWKEYNKNVNIENRKNIKTQNHFAPKKYRWFMNEF